MAGRVETVGRKVSRFRPGDEVWADLFGSGSGAFAEYVCAREGVFHPKSAELTFEQAATLPHSGLLALQGLDGRGRVRPGERVLINGAGGCVGPFAIQLAKAFGAEVSAVDHTEKLDLLVSLGADHVIDYTREDFTKSGRRYDLILDIAATRSVFAYRRSLKEGGRYVLVARTLAGFFSAALFGALISMGGTKEMGVFKWVPNKREDLDYLGEAVADGKVDAVVDRTYDLAEVPDGIRHLQAGRARGKLMVTP
jgi:NADPH:quinone reductase-like Zn-dependent oxidoreductase